MPLYSNVHLISISDTGLEFLCKIFIVLWDVCNKISGNWTNSYNKCSGKTILFFPQHVTSMIFVEEKCITWPIISAAQYCQHKIFYCYAESCCKITRFSFIFRRYYIIVRLVQKSYSSIPNKYISARSNRNYLTIGIVTIGLNTNHNKSLGL